MPEDNYIHPNQLQLFNPWKYDVPFLDFLHSTRKAAPKPTAYVAEMDVAYEDADQRLGGNDNPYGEDGGW